MNHVKPGACCIPLLFAKIPKDSLNRATPTLPFHLPLPLVSVPSTRVWSSLFMRVVLSLILAGCRRSPIGCRRSPITKLPSLPSATMINTTNKSNFTEERVYLVYCLIMGNLWESQGRTTKQELKEAGALEEHCFLAFSSWTAQFDFLHNPGSPAQEWHCPQWTALPQINH